MQQVSGSLQQLLQQATAAAAMSAAAHQLGSTLPHAHPRSNRF
jgi:hypothetical protein